MTDYHKMNNPNIEKITHHVDDTSLVELKNGSELRVKHKTHYGVDPDDNNFDWIVHHK